MINISDLKIDVSNAIISDSNEILNDSSSSNNTNNICTPVIIDKEKHDKECAKRSTVCFLLGVFGVCIWWISNT